MWFVILNICGMLWLMSMIGSLWVLMFLIRFSICWFFLILRVVVGLFMIIILELNVVVCVIVIFWC